MTSRQVAEEDTVRQNALQNAILALAALPGCLCVYNEVCWVYLVRVVKIGIDDWGAYFDLAVVPAPGFDHCRLTEFQVSVHWSSFSVTDRAVLAMAVTWRLLTRPDLVQEIVAAAAQGQAGIDLISHIHELASGVPH